MELSVAASPDDVLVEAIAEDATQTAQASPSDCDAEEKLPFGFYAVRALVALVYLCYTRIIIELPDDLSPQVARSAIFFRFAFGRGPGVGCMGDRPSVGRPLLY